MLLVLTVATVVVGLGSVKGRVVRNSGFCLACVTASKPEASLMSVGSLNAVLKKDIPTGTPNVIPIGTLMFVYPTIAGGDELPTTKGSALINAVEKAGLCLGGTS